MKTIMEARFPCVGMGAALEIGSKVAKREMKWAEMSAIPKLSEGPDRKAESVQGKLSPAANGYRFRRRSVGLPQKAQYRSFPPHRRPCGHGSDDDQVCDERSYILELKRVDEP
ncbi:hypothetical protein [Rhizobium leguminosarum]|uniref:hypothetical protein n=1 Tax=Rhizobium leguminosarum TaxID=384 RepID=UPI0039655CE8